MIAYTPIFLEFPETTAEAKTTSSVSLICTAVHISSTERSVRISFLFVCSCFSTERFKTVCDTFPTFIVSVSLNPLCSCSQQPLFYTRYGRIIVAIIATTSTSAPIAITLLTLLSLKSTVFTSLNSHTQWVF